MSSNLGADLDAEVLAAPIEVIVRLVAGVESDLDIGRIREVVDQVAGGRAKRRRLAQLLLDGPEVLITGRPPVAWSVGQLLLALRAAGARHVAAPRCGRCGRDLTYLICRGSRVVCSPCSDLVQPCAGCGSMRRVHTRDRHGRPRCADCPDLDGDPLDALAQLVCRLDPAMTAGAVMAAVRRATVRPAVQRRLAWAVVANSDLLTGAGADAPTPTVLRLIDELIAVGATSIVRPACPRCRRTVALSERLDGQRVCRTCRAHAVAVPCARCGAVREPAARDPGGRPLCPNCLARDPGNLEDCRGCGRRRRVAVRTSAGPFCPNCRPRKTLACGICGRVTPCEVSRATGLPWCEACQQWWASCSGCQVVSPVRGGTRTAPLCARCLNPDPAFWDRCPVCRTTWQLSPRPCARCTLKRRVGELLRDPTGHVRDDLTPLQQALTRVERPDTALVWMAGRAVHQLLAEFGAGRPMTHQALDALPTSKTLDHLRSILVAAGALPDRDERLVRLERGMAMTIAARSDPTERRLLQRYAVWHHLRRLRSRLGGTPATYLQVLNVRCHVTAAVGLLDWLAGHGRTLASCTQADLDRWAAHPDAAYRAETGHFVRWAVTNRQASGLTLTAPRWDGPRGPHDTEHRWGHARRLLHDHTLPPGDRVAVLLLVLYAQRLSTISTLTVDHVHRDGDRVELRLGAAPVVLPEPLAGLVLELVATRRPHTVIGHAIQTRWLSPGQRPGQPISADRLRQRLRAIGIRAQRVRSTALFTLATELPAAILARMLGIHIKVAVQWQRAAAGDWANYAADVSRRARRPCL